jgi:hypothetical protein
VALAPRDIPITREAVDEWLAEYDKLPADRPPLKEFIASKIDELNLEDPFVDVGPRDDFSGNEVHIADYLMEDIHTYGNYKDNGQ